MVGCKKPQVRLLPSHKTNNKDVKIMNRIETLIGEAILQDAQPLEIEGVGTLQVAHPSVATLIEASKSIGDLPVLPSIRGQEDTALAYVMAHARDCAVLGDVAAVLILGKKGINRRIKKALPAKSWKNNRFFNLFRRKVSLREVLANVLLEDYTPKQLQNIITSCLGMQEIGFFLNITISLNEANLLRQTTSATTASGQ